MFSLTSPIACIDFGRIHWIKLFMDLHVLSKAARNLPSLLEVAKLLTQKLNTLNCEAKLFNIIRSFLFFTNFTTLNVCPILNCALGLI